MITFLIIPPSSSPLSTDTLIFQFISAYLLSPVLQLCNLSLHIFHHQFLDISFSRGNLLISSYMSALYSTIFFQSWLFQHTSKQITIESIELWYQLTQTKITQERKQAKKIKLKPNKVVTQNSKSYFYYQINRSYVVCLSEKFTTLK